MKPGDIDREQGLLRVNDGKGGADRIVPLGAIAARCLETYANAIRPELVRAARAQRGAACEWLFVSYTGRQIDPNTLNAIVRKYAKAARIENPVTCHTWRHSCATHLVQNNANVRHVQEMLGHRRSGAARCGAVRSRRALPKWRGRGSRAWCLDRRPRGCVWLRQA